MANVFTRIEGERYHGKLGREERERDQEGQGARGREGREPVEADRVSRVGATELLGAKKAVAEAGTKASDSSQGEKIPV